MLCTSKHLDVFGWAVKGQNYIVGTRVLLARLDFDVSGGDALELTQLRVIGARNAPQQFTRELKSASTIISNMKLLY